ncbi:hypothetical protein NMG60_11032113 [Bertholletia excelsa]
MTTATTQRHPSDGPQVEPLPTAATTAAMDETALRALQCLQEKLGSFRPSRLNRSNKTKKARLKSTTTRRISDTTMARGKQDSLVTKILGRPWNLQITRRSNSEGQRCAVCLEDIRSRGKQPVVKLSCSHKYHSDCLRPWLAAADHPNCPCCRTPIPPWQAR